MKGLRRQTASRSTTELTNELWVPVKTGAPLETGGGQKPSMVPLNDAPDTNAPPRHEVVAEIVHLDGQRSAVRGGPEIVRVPEGARGVACGRADPPPPTE